MNLKMKRAPRMIRLQARRRVATPAAGYPDLNDVADAFSFHARQLQSVFDEVARRVQASCHKGCAHCCRLIVPVTFGEALTVARTLPPDERARVALEARAQLPFMGTPPWGAVAYPRGMACVLLVNEQCQVYHQRPWGCRIHLVTSPPSDCAPYGPNAPMTVSSPEILEAVQHITLHVYRLFELSWVGPLPLLLWWAIRLLEGGWERFEAERMACDDPELALDRWVRNFPV